MIDVHNEVTGRRSGWLRALACLAGMAVMTTSCGLFGDDETTGPSGQGGGPVGAASIGAGDQSRLRVFLSQGQSVGPVGELAVVDGTTLSPAEVDAILSRLPDEAARPEDTQAFNRPADSLRPPLVGDTLTAAFPPPLDNAPDPGTTSSGPLHVLRFQPEGDVGIAPFLSVTFDQPMVPLATLDQLAASDVPVQLSPAVEGRWRWIGTRTLRFEVEPGAVDRLPAATEFTATVAAGTRSVTDGELAEAVSWTFATPAPRVASLTGLGDAMGLSPVLVAVFDQLVDPQSVLDTSKLVADGDDQPVRIATEAEIEADDAAARAVADAGEGRWVAFRPADPLPAASDVDLTIGPGTPSAEGPLTTATADTHTGHTFDAFAMIDHSCNYGGSCVPLAPFFLTANNPIDVDRFEPSMVTVKPDIPGLRVSAVGNQISVTGATRGRTSYTVTVSGEVADTFGQTLGKDHDHTFEVGPARPLLAPFPRQFLTLDPMADRPGLAVTTVNHESMRVTAWKVTPADLSSYQAYLERTYSNTDPGDPRWPRVYDEEVAIDGSDDAATETLVDLGAAYEAAGTGQLVVRVSPTRTFDPNSEDYWSNRPTIAWVQATTLGIDAILDNQQIVVWTNDLTTGEPRPGVTVSLVGTNRTVTTDDNGLARTEIGSGVTGLEAPDGDGTGSALLPSSWFGAWQSQAQGDEARWYVFDDRGVYKPGETVRVTGWVRRQDLGGDAQLGLYANLATVGWRATDPMGSELATGTASVNPLGGFNLSFDLPAGANLGQAWVELSAPGVATQAGGGFWTHQFQIQDFRTPEFEVTARPESPGPYYSVDPATVAVDAAYYAGGPLPDAEVGWTVSTASTTYRPPNWDRFTFGVWQPWWLAGTGEQGYVATDIGYRGDIGYGGPGCFGPGCPPGTGADVQTFAGRTNPDGSHYLRLDFDGPAVDLPTTVTAEASVTDVNRQAWASRTDLVVHPARYYVGLRSDRPFVEQGTPLRIDTVVTDVDGSAVAGRPVEVTAGRLEWTWSNGQWTEELADTQTCALTPDAVTAGDQPLDANRCQFSTDVGGTYRITAVVTDDDGHRNRSELTMWVTGGGGRPSRLVEQEQVTIVPDAPTYGAGDTAQLLVQSPFGPGHGVATISRGGILTTQAFDAPDGSAVVDIPIEDAWTPGVTVQIDMTGTAPRLNDDGTPAEGAPPRPAFATGTIELSIPPVTRALTVTATPADPALTPGSDTSVVVSVTGPDGQPAEGADVALVVVDEAVLSLTGYELTDPLDVFYGPIWSRVFAEYTRSGIVLSRPDLLLSSGGDVATTEAGAATADSDTAALEESSTTMASAAVAPGASARLGSKAAADDGAGAPIVVRSDFNPLAVYAPDRATGPDGTVTVEVPLPDSLTRYRVMAVAVDGAQRFGRGESTITARLPLMVRPSAPRFLNFGDRLELPVMVQNQTDAAMEVDVALDTANLTLTDGAGKRITVPANDRVEVRFPAAAEETGTARFRVVGATAGTGSGPADAAAVELPVYTPATAEAFATYGVVDDGAVAQPITAPTGVFPQFGGLEIDTSSTAVQALTDAVLYLHDYRYDSAEGYASRIMAVAALRDVLDAFKAEGLPDKAGLDAQVQRDITRLAALQNDDGGFPSWQRGQRSNPWATIQATHAVVLAGQAGYTVPGDTVSRALDRLATIEALFDDTYGQDVRDSLSAYALNVRHSGGSTDKAKALDLYRRAGDRLQLDALAWLWPVLDDASARSEIERTFINRATETAGAASFATSYGDDAYLIAASDRRTDGIVLDALITEAPTSDLIPKVVAGLLANQRRGRWDNALENGFILVAMKHYFDTFEAVTSDFVARAWLGDTYAAEHQFQGRTTDRAETVVPMAEVIAGGDSRVVVAKDGPGRLYYRLGLRYAPDDLTLAPRDEGFVVDRVYEATGDAGDVSRDADGTWRIKAGATVRVKLTMVADAVRTNVALIDPLPAGLEPLNPALEVSPTPPPVPTADGSGDGDSIRPVGWCWCWQWYEHQNLRDDRAEAFTSYLPGGTYTYTYTARATTPGNFVVPPTRAEEMYAPETFGRSASANVIVG